MKLNTTHHAIRSTALITKCWVQKVETYIQGFASMKCLESLVTWCKTKSEKRKEKHAKRAKETRIDLIRVTFIMKSAEHIKSTPLEDIYDYEVEVREEWKVVPASSKPCQPHYDAVHENDMKSNASLDGCTISTTTATFRSIHHAVEAEIQPKSSAVVTLPFGLITPRTRPPPKYFREVDMFELGKTNVKGPVYQFKIYE